MWPSVNENDETNSEMPLQITNLGHPPNHQNTTQPLILNAISPMRSLSAPITWLHRMICATNYQLCADSTPRLTKMVQTDEVAPYIKSDGTVGEASLVEWPSGRGATIYNRFFSYFFFLLIYFFSFLVFFQLITFSARFPPDKLYW